MLLEEDVSDAKNVNNKGKCINDFIKGVVQL